MAKKKTTRFGWLGILLLFSLHCGLILGTLYFVWSFGHRHLIEPAAGTWDGWSDMPLQIKMYWGVMIFLVFSAIYFVYKVFHSIRKLF